MIEETVTISRETYDSLVNDSKMLDIALDNNFVSIGYVHGRTLLKRELHECSETQKTVVELVKEKNRLHKTVAERFDLIQGISEMSIFGFIKWKRKQNKL